MNHLERLSNFPSQNVPLTPDQLYIDFKTTLPAEKHHYITGPINSGGARRRYNLEGAQGEELLKMLDSIVKENVVFANSLLRLILRLHLIDKQTVVTSPYRLGPRQMPANGSDTDSKPWTETEYLLFWSMVISGMSATAASEYYWTAYEKIKGSSQSINAREMAREQRINQYRLLEDVVIGTLSSLPSQSVTPISGLLKFPDSHFSLGSTFEQRLAFKLGVPMQEVSFNLEHPYFEMYAISKDDVLQYLRSVENGLKVVNDASALFPVAIVPFVEEPQYT